MISVALLRISTLKIGRTRQSQLQTVSEQKQKVHGCVIPLPQRVASVHTVHTVNTERDSRQRGMPTHRGEDSKYLVLNYKPSGTGENTH